jgi:hypothetical protein
MLYEETYPYWIGKDNLEPNLQTLDKPIPTSPTWKDIHHNIASLPAFFYN